MTTEGSAYNCFEVTINDCLLMTYWTYFSIKTRKYTLLVPIVLISIKCKLYNHLILFEAGAVIVEIVPTSSQL